MSTKYMTKQQFSETLGMSYRTFQRRIKEINIKTSHGLLSPEAQDFIAIKLKEYELKKWNKLIK